MNHLSTNVGQAFLASLMKKGESFVVQSQDMQNGGMDIVQMHAFFNRFKSEVVRSTVA